MTEAELVDLLGPEAVVRRQSYIGEGFCAPGGRVFPDTDAEIEVMWSDTAYSSIASLTLRKPSSPWRTPAGVHMGSTVKELEAIGGESIQFSGFGWDYGGGSNWTEGDLRIGLRLDPTPESEEPVRDDPQYLELIGDRLVQSDHPIARRLDILVWMISLQGQGGRLTEFECTG